MKIPALPSTSLQGLRLALALLACFPPVISFSWRHEVRVRPPLQSPSEALESKARLPDVYTVALTELKELEAQPLCHRVAARLLVNNCQLLDGKDEATMLTDSGRQLRDFVDSYAASLAICDLERGSFAIPRQCDKFREAALSRLAARDDGEVHMHVTSAEIDSCLSALGVSDSAWNTWVSYRHKALRFCEAARADNEKAQSVLLYQRLTKIMARLTDGVEAELQRRMSDLDDRARQAAERVDQLNPHIDQLKDGLVRVEEYLASHVEQAARRSEAWMRGGLEHAAGLERTLEVLVKTVMNGTVQVAAAQREAVELATRQAGSEFSALVGALASAAAASEALQTQLELSLVRAAKLEAKQDFFEDFLDEVHLLSQVLLAEQAEHIDLQRESSDLAERVLYNMTQFSNMTGQIRDNAVEALNVTAQWVNNTRLLKQALAKRQSDSWLPHIICPTLAVIGGSYRLPPSVARNLALLALGEAAAVAVVSYDHIRLVLHSFSPFSVDSQPVFDEDEFEEEVFDEEACGNTTAGEV